MNLAIALIAVFALAQFLTFGVLLYFAVQFVRVKDLTLDLSAELVHVWERLNSIQDWVKRQEAWAESMTDFQDSIIDRIRRDED